MKRIAAGVLCALSLSGSVLADGPPWGKSIAEGFDLPRPFGLGFDYFSMEQDYQIRSLQFNLPGVPPIPPELVQVDNDIDHRDLKFDVWVLPFLNVFAIYGHVNARTHVDLTNVPAAALGLPPLGVIPVRYDGDVYGGGMTLAYGSERWFTSLTGTWTHSNLDGDFDSSVRSQSWQPRLGLLRGAWAGWIGGQYIAVEEDHAGVIQLIPALPPIPFSVSLEEENAWNPVVGARYAFNDQFELAGEYGGGQRDTLLVNATWRFGNSD
jgi:hypothetical protein